MTGIDAFLELLAGAGVHYLFGNPGTTELPLNDALARDNRFQYILGVHEVPVMAMTEGYALASRSLGVVNVHIACGLGNAMGMLYNAHCATLGRRARMKAWCSRKWRNTVRRLVWRGQDWSLWLLEHGYDIQPKEEKGSPFAAPFRVYNWADFVRGSDEKGAHFFGFQSSKRSLSSNLIVLLVMVAMAYWLLPHAKLLRVVESIGQFSFKSEMLCRSAN